MTAVQDLRTERGGPGRPYPVSDDAQMIGA
jgi:hypothetical protein